MWKNLQPLRQWIFPCFVTFVDYHTEKSSEFTGNAFHSIRRKFKSKYIWYLVMYFQLLSLWQCSQPDKPISVKTKPAPPPPPPPITPLNHQPRSRHIPDGPRPAKTTDICVQNKPSVTANVDVHVQSVQGQTPANQSLSACLQELKTIHNKENTHNSK